MSGLALGLVAGCCTQCSTSPLKVVAIRLAAGTTTETGMLEATANIWREGGLSGFFRGNLTGLAAQPLTIALSFLFFERLKIFADGIDMLPNAVPSQF